MPSSSSIADNSTLASKLALLEGILDDSNQLVQMSYLDDMTMVYVNGTARAFRGGCEDYHGRHCYEYMMGFDEQCPFCPLLTQGSKRSACTDVDNGQQVFSVKTTLTEWEGRAAFVEYATDVTPNRRAQQGFETQMSTLLQSIPEAQGIMHLDLTQDKCITVSGSAKNNLKSVQSDVAVDTTLAQTFAFIPDEAMRQEMTGIYNRKALISAYENGTVEISREVKSYFDDMSVRWARITARILQNPSNDHLECILYGMDISEEVNQRDAYEKQSHHQLALFNTLARDYLNVYLVDPDADKVKVLKLQGFMTSTLCGEGDVEYPYQATCERYIAERVHPDDKDMMRRALSIEAVKQALSMQEEYVSSYRILDNGKTHFYQFKYVVAENNEGILAGFMNVDNTIAAEREQQELLKTALLSAEEANAAKSTFLSNMSHDIRTPLNAIIGFNELAKKHADDPEATRRYLEKVTISSNHLLNLINDVLDMSRIESGQAHVDKACIHLPSMFNELHTIIAANANASDITLVFDTSNIQHTHVIGDELKIKKILMNILGNAVKFTEANGTVTFIAEERKLRTSRYAHFLFRIKDTGIGMSSEFQKHVYEAFSRENHESRDSTSGTGLGLSIVKSLVNILDGSIHLESERGAGSEFTVSLHLEIANAEQGDVKKAPSKQAKAQGFTSKRVLLVEDNEFNREIAFEMLTEAGLEVDTAEDGRIAVHKIVQAVGGTYDAVLMDIQMPNMNGYEATRAIRNLPDPTRANVPIIAVTANAFSSDRDEALAAGMDGHIAKPIDAKLLINKLHELAG